MTNPKIVQVGAVITCAVLLFASSSLAPAINAGRAEMNTTGITDADPLKSAPPEYAFAIQALGAFRGLATNFAFIRATQLKEAGRYFDAMQLANWICTLQPRFPSVWEFQAWNMAWNISVTTFTPEERWNWVYNGVKLIRDEGLKYNPRAVNLYKMIAWIYVNKMSETIDDYHLTFKRQWAWRMHVVLGEPPDPLKDENPDVHIDGLLIDGNDRFAKALRQADAAEKDEDSSPPAPPSPDLPDVPEAEPIESPFEVVREARVLQIQRIADAPRTLEALYEQHPETREMVARLRDMGVEITDRELSEDSYWGDQRLSFTFFRRYRKLTDRVSILAQIVKNAPDDPDLANVEVFDQIVGAREQRPAGQALLRFLQRKVLHEVYNLDPEKMVEVMKFFGPVDWRVVDAHSLYWIAQSIIQGHETLQEFGNDKINTTRLLFFSLRNLNLRNKLIFEPYPPAIHLSYFNPTPDIHFIEPMQRAFIEYGPLLSGARDVGPGAGNTYRTGHINFLTESIRTLYLENRIAEASKYYEYLRQTYHTSPSGEFNPAFMDPLEDYVRKSLMEGLEGGREAALAINAWMTNAYNALAGREFVQYQNLRKMALEVHRNYHGRIPNMAESKKLAPFNEMQVDTLLFMYRRPSITPVVALHKVELWRNLPQNLKRTVYDPLNEFFAIECDVWNFDVAKAFPEPAGMQAFRDALERRGPEDQKKDFITPVQPGG